MEQNGHSVRFAELNQQPLSQTIVDVIRRAIVTCQLAPGAPINQVDLARDLNTSRGPVREALRQLEEEGLVTSIAYKGTFVATLTRRDLDELGTLRAVLEPFAARRVIQHASDEEIASLGRIVDDMESAVERQDWDARDVLDIRFHTRICQLADHRLLMQYWERFKTQLERAQRLRNRVGDDTSRLVAMHRELYESIRTRDEARMEAAYRGHGANLAQRVSEILPETASLPGRDRVH